MSLQRDDCLILRVLKQPAQIRQLDLPQWDLLVRQARRADLLASLYGMFRQHDLQDDIPSMVANHFIAATVVADKHAAVMQWEIGCIASALAKTGVPLILLKGGAYLIRKLPASAGRLYSDTDILVPRDRLIDVEQALIIHGWMSMKLDSYDQRYYRTWMHELPPMLHRHRQTSLDVHHRILPETCRARPDPQKLIAASEAVGQDPQLRTLSPVDMVIHSATHLFYEGEFDHGLRDLLDLRALLGTYAKEEGFWDTLVRRAFELELEQPVYYALRYLHGLLAVEIPPSVMDWLKPTMPGPIRGRLMDGLFRRALVPNHDSCDLPYTAVARWMLYVRSHYLRMPLHLLLPHLIHKAMVNKET